MLQVFCFHSLLKLKLALLLLLLLACANLLSKVNQSPFNYTYMILNKYSFKYDFFFMQKLKMEMNK